MGAPPPANLPTAPPIPLTPDLRAAYEDLNDKLEAEIENTADVTALQALNAQQTQVDDLLTQDALFQLGNNTIAFETVLTQLNSTNDGLKTLQTQINQTAQHFQTAGDILGAIAKVFGLLGIS